jgi:biotin carboxyl carrier protein
MKYFVTAGDREIEIEVDGDHVVIAGERVPAALTAIPGSPVRLLQFGGRSLAVPIETAGTGRWAVTIHGERREIEVVDARTRHIRSLTGDTRKQAAGGSLRAPMPGLVVRVQVEVGQDVAGGTPVVVLEAMKMENQLKTAGPVRITAVRVAPGQAVEKGQVLLEYGSAAP